MDVSRPVSSPELPRGSLPFHGWLLEGLRAGFFLKPRAGGAQPRAWHLAAVVLLIALHEIGLGRLEVDGPALFNLRQWLGSWWTMAAFAPVLWLLLTPRHEAGDLWPDRPAGLWAWFVLWLLAMTPANLFSQFIGIAYERQWMPAQLVNSRLFVWTVYLAGWVWIAAATLRLAWHFGLRGGRQAALFASLLIVFGVHVWQYADRYWTPDWSQAEQPARLALSQEVFEQQQAVWQQSVAALAPERAGVADVYGLVFAPYASEDVFLRESTMVAGVLAERFDAQGRVLHLMNHATTADRLPWATPANLQRGIAAIAERMDRENDILVVYMTSHGASNFHLAADHWPLQMESVTPQELRTYLDQAGIRHRVIAISACYSGGWVEPLANDETLVMTAADATHTSYGCGRLSELTFFGRAVFDEELRKTHSFEKAFAAAVPVIRQREVEAGKPDGFSNPQLHVGPKIGPVLDALAQRLDRP